MHAWQANRFVYYGAEMSNDENCTSGLVQFTCAGTHSQGKRKTTRSVFNSSMTLIPDVFLAAVLHREAVVCTQKPYPIN